MKLFKHHYFKFLILIVLLFGCEDPIQEVQNLQSPLKTEIPSELKMSRKDLINILSSNELKEQLPEYLGDLMLSENLLFDNVNGFHIGVTPFQNNGKTSALIMSSKKHDVWKHVLIENQKLEEYYSQPIQPLTPTKYMIQQLFEVFNERQGLKGESTPVDLFQSRTNNFQPSEKSIESFDGFDEKNGWVEVCEFVEIFHHKTDDGVITYQTFSGSCHWEYYWEATPGQTITIDAGGSGGGGGSGTTLTLKEAQERDIDNERDLFIKAHKQATYIKVHGTEEEQELARFYQDLLESFYLDNLPEPAYSLLLAEINKVWEHVSGRIPILAFSPILSAAKPFLEIALVGYISDGSILIIDKFLKTKLGIQLLNSLTNLKNTVNPAPRFTFMSESKKMIEYRVHSNRLDYMNFLSKETGKQWNFVTWDIYMLEHNGFTYTIRSFGKTWPGPTVEVFNGIGDSKVIISKLRLNK